jgi:hypothetical protein
VLALPLVSPDASHEIGLVTAAREPIAPLTRELFAVAHQADFGSQIEASIPIRRP